MKITKKIFPFMLIFAILFTVIGLVSVNLTFSMPNDSTKKSFNVFIDGVESENIDVVGYSESNIAYTILLDEYKKEYSISFDITNDSIFNLVLANQLMSELPEELKELMTYTVDMKTRLAINEKDKVTIKYVLKDNLTNKELSVVKKYNNVGINVSLNYIQE